MGFSFTDIHKRTDSNSEYSFAFIHSLVGIGVWESSKWNMKSGTSYDSCIKQDGINASILPIQSTSSTFGFSHPLFTRHSDFFDDDDDYEDEIEASFQFNGNRFRVHVSMRTTRHLNKNNKKISFSIEIIAIEQQCVVAYLTLAADQALG